jgi:hypothetical protein
MGRLQDPTIAPCSPAFAPAARADRPAPPAARTRAGAKRSPSAFCSRRRSRSAARSVVADNRRRGARRGDRNFQTRCARCRSPRLGPAAGDGKTAGDGGPRPNLDERKASRVGQPRISSKSLGISPGRCKHNPGPWTFPLLAGDWRLFDKGGREWPDPWGQRRDALTENKGLISLSRAQQYRHFVALGKLLLAERKELSALLAGSHSLYCCA